MLPQLRGCQCVEAAVIPGFNDALREAFPGCPELRHGYLYPRPGLGVDLDESLAAKHPCKPVTETWTQTRLPDGSVARP